MKDANECVKGKASYDLIQVCVGMGFREEHVLKVIKEFGKIKVVNFISFSMFVFISSALTDSYAFRAQ
jgi:hypothetical protein